MYFFARITPLACPTTNEVVGPTVHMCIVQGFPFCGGPHGLVAQGGGEWGAVSECRPMTGWMWSAGCDRDVLAHTTQHSEAMRPDDCSSSTGLEHLQTDLYRALGRVYTRPPSLPYALL